MLHAMHSTCMHTHTYQCEVGVKRDANSCAIGEGTAGVGANKRTWKWSKAMPTTLPFLATLEHARSSTVSSPTMQKNCNLALSSSLSDSSTDGRLVGSKSGGWLGK